MYVRLAFAVAAHLEPDILIVDEVLAVGDSAFQQKCLGKMRDIRSEGRTVIVVSHNMATVSSLCQKVIWLDAGRVRASGDASKVISTYLSEGATREMSWTPRVREGFPLTYDMVSVVRGDTGESRDAIPADVPVDFVVDFTISEAMTPGRIAISVSNEAGELLLTTTSADRFAEAAHKWTVGEHRLRCRIPGYLLSPGVYYVSLTEPRGAYDIVRDNVLAFTVSEENSLSARDGRDGRITPLLEWTTEAR
jgi:lipopolysaccharide transport system ATP-binding protein